MINIKKSRLEAGITVVTERIEDVHSFSLGFWVVVGSRNENRLENGISHFIEHTIFKGTKKRNVKEIARVLESKGAALDAFTSKEVTCFYSRGLDTQLKLAVDVIADILTNPIFPEEEIKKEIGVVKEEIKDNEDSPEKLIFDKVFEKIYIKHPLSNSILGDKKNVEGFTRAKTLAYFRKWYKPERIVVAASGFLEHNEVLDYLKPYFKPQKSSNKTFFKPVKNHYKPNIFKYRKKGLFQSHLLIATPTFNYKDPRKYPLLVLDTVLGEGMSSILFQRVREEKGLVYQIFSFADFFSDEGVFGIYLACDPKKIEIAKKTVIKELTKLRRNGLSKRRVSEAKIRLKSKLIIGQESTSNRMLRLGRNAIYRGKIVTIDEVIGAVDAVNQTDVNNVIDDVLHEDNFSSIYIGDFGKSGM